MFVSSSAYCINNKFYNGETVLSSIVSPIPVPFKNNKQLNDTIFFDFLVPTATSNKLTDENWNFIFHANQR